MSASADSPIICVGVAGFLDDSYLFATSLTQAQEVLNELSLELSKAGLFLNPLKVRWNASKHVPLAESARLKVGKVQCPRSHEFRALGYVITDDRNEASAYDHRIKCAWGCFHKWSKILLSRAPLMVRLRLMGKVVLPSLLWGLQTTQNQQHTSGNARLAACQRTMVRNMLNLKRRPTKGGGI